MLPVEQRSQPFDKPVCFCNGYPPFGFKRVSDSLQRDFARMLRKFGGICSRFRNQLTCKVFTYGPSLTPFIVRLSDDKLAVNEARGELRLCPR
ncbi:hypothetical protein LMG22931_01265 [Paraburkholderia nemoris]|nr:hypothetical protein LMG22931_01265 [Paraburkholderia nemoris]